MAYRNINVIKENYWKILVKKKIKPRVKRNNNTLNFLQVIPKICLYFTVSS